MEPTSFSHKKETKTYFAMNSNRSWEIADRHLVEETCPTSASLLTEARQKWNKKKNDAEQNCHKAEHKPRRAGSKTKQNKDLT